MFHPLNVLSSLTGVKEMSENQERSNIIDQINEAKSETSCDQRKTMIKIAVFLMAIVAFVMALQ
jgi:hypothetical protein